MTDFTNDITGTAPAADPQWAVQSPVFLAFPELRHGSTTRAFSTREADRTLELRRTQAVLGIPQSYPIVHGDQRHSATVAVIQGGDFPPSAAQDGRHCAPETDALVCTVPGVTIAVFSADCVPVFFYDPVTGAIAVAHAGWRGTLARIASVTLRTMGEAAGTDPEDVHVWIGPAISGRRYEVDAELIEKFRREFSEIDQKDMQWYAGRHLDLPELNRLQLAIDGVPLDQVQMSGICTLGQKERFYSYRGDGGPTGRIVSAMAVLPEGDQCTLPTPPSL